MNIWINLYENRASTDQCYAIISQIIPMLIISFRRYPQPLSRVFQSTAYSRGSTVSSSKRYLHAWTKLSQLDCHLTKIVDIETWFP